MSNDHPKTFNVFARVKAVNEGDGSVFRQCLYSQRYGTVMQYMGDNFGWGPGWYDVLLDGMFRAWYHADQLMEAEPQQENAA